MEKDYTPIKIWDESKNDRIHRQYNERTEIYHPELVSKQQVSTITTTKPKSNGITKDVFKSVTKDVAIDVAVFAAKKLIGL